MGRVSAGSLLHPEKLVGSGMSGSALGTPAGEFPGNWELGKEAVVLLSHYGPESSQSMSPRCTLGTEEFWGHLA